MMNRAGTPLNDVQNLLVRRDVRSRPVLRALQHRLYGSRIHRRTRLFERGNRDFLVTRIAIPVRVDNWVVRRIRAVNGDISAREWRHSGHANGCKIVDCGHTVDEIVEVAREGVEREQLNVRPVGAKLGHKVLGRLIGDGAVREVLEGEDVTAHVGEDAGSVVHVLFGSFSAEVPVPDPLMRDGVDGIGNAESEVVP